MEAGVLADLELRPFIRSVDDNQGAQEVFSVKSYVCSEILETKTVKAKLDQPSFMNLAVKVKALGEEYSSVGLYALFFDDALIYVGAFGVSPQHNLYTGNVIKARWWTHIMSVTLRGSRLNRSKNAFAVLDFETFYRDHPVVRTLRSFDIERDRGNLTTPNRARFAIDHWSVFGSGDSLPLDRFSFSYIRSDSSARSMISDKSMRQAVRDAETEAKATLKPRCNTETAPGTALDSVHPQEAKTALYSALESQVQRHSDGGEQ